MSALFPIERALHNGLIPVGKRASGYQLADQADGPTRHWGK